MIGPKQTIIVDSGRHAVKCMSGKTVKIFPSVVAPAVGFKTPIDLSNPEYYWINSDKHEFLVGNLAILQSEVGTQERDQAKSNTSNLILILTAISLFAHPGSVISLVINLPARDWKKQKETLKEMFENKSFCVTHKAGERQGLPVDFYVDSVSVLPEGAGAVYGWIYNDDLQLIREHYMEGEVLVIDVGDQTINYIVLKDGEYSNADCGSIDEGNRKALQDVVDWLNIEGRPTTQAELSRAIIQGKPIYIGKNPVPVAKKLLERQAIYSQMAFSLLNGKFNFKRFHHILFAGGAGSGYSVVFRERLGGICDIDCPDIAEAQILNLRGFSIMKRLKDAGRSR